MIFPRREDASNKDLILTIIEIQSFLQRYGKTHTNWHETLNEVIAKLEEEPNTEWIPVSEAIPIIETDVLLTSWSGKAEYVGWIDAFGKWHADEGDVIDGYEPLAWMPLPPCYVPQESEE